MKYRVQIDGHEREINVQITPGGSVVATMDDKPVDIDVRRIPGGVNLRIGGKSYDVIVGGEPSAMQLAAGPIRATAQVESERMRKRRSRQGGAISASELRAPMPGRIVKVFVSTGDKVEQDQPLVVIEAMKMENELRATAAGTVKSVEAQEGQNVDGNAVLIRFEDK